MTVPNSKQFKSGSGLNLYNRAYIVPFWQRYILGKVHEGRRAWKGYRVREGCRTQCTPAPAPSSRREEGTSASQPARREGKGIGNKEKQKMKKRFSKLEASWNSEGSAYKKERGSNSEWANLNTAPPEVSHTMHLSRPTHPLPFVHGSYFELLPVMSRLLLRTIMKQLQGIARFIIGAVYTR